MGGPDVACQILKTALSHVIVARNKALPPVGYQNLPCRMSRTILGPMSPVKFKKGPWRLSILRMPLVGPPCRIEATAVSHCQFKDTSK